MVGNFTFHFKFTSATPKRTEGPEDLKCLQENLLIKYKEYIEEQTGQDKATSVDMQQCKVPEVQKMLG